MALYSIMKMIAWNDFTLIVIHKGMPILYSVVNSTTQRYGAVAFIWKVTFSMLKKNTSKYCLVASICNVMFLGQNNSFWSWHIYLFIYMCAFWKDFGQTKPKPKPRGGKKLQKLTAVEQEGESRCLFRATNGKRKLSTVVSRESLLILSLSIPCEWDRGRYFPVQLIKP